jgi:hypothetical protein
MLGQAVPVKRRRVEQIDAQGECSFHRGNGRRVVKAQEEITEWRSSDPEDGDLKTRAAELAAWL